MRSLKRLNKGYDMWLLRAVTMTIDSGK